MSRYSIELLWADSVNTVDEPRRPLMAQDMERAKFEAAMIFAGYFKGPPPSGYRLLQDGDLEVYRYPEHFH